jgi:hypothetical protein
MLVDLVGQRLIRVEVLSSAVATLYRDLLGFDQKTVITLKRGFDDLLWLPRSLGRELND